MVSITPPPAPSAALATTISLLSLSSWSSSPASTQDIIRLSAPMQQQNHLENLAKSLPPARRQNVACDACRSRKVRCTRLPGKEKCQHCITKNYPCTHYVQQATTERKRMSVNRRLRNSNSANGSVASSGSSKSPPADSSTVTNQPYGTPYSLSLPYQLPNSRSSPQSATAQLLAYLFSPEGPTDPASFSANRGLTPTYQDWGEMSKRLESEAFRVEFALDLVEVFFQICHTRLPLLNPTQFRSRLKLDLAQTSSVPEKPLHPALLATVLAWGAKFSEHPLLVADREDNGGQNRIARTLVNRAREVAEAEKVHRINTADHVIIALLIEPLQSQTPDDPDGFHGFWLTAAIRHLLALRMNHKSVLAGIQDLEARGPMTFAWWMACLSDAYHSAYYRRKPILDDDDYDIDFYTVDPVPLDIHQQNVELSPREQYEFIGYYRASHALARICRYLSTQLWRPVTESHGILFDVLCGIITSLNEWRDQHLPRVGVPSDFESEWDFVSAVSACASDATYHVMWVILFNAVDDYGIKDFNDAVRMNPVPNVISNPTIETAKHKILDEALHGALRIAGLTGVLTSNGYLKLDPAVMHYSCLTAGMLLARLGRPEVTNCIAGLKQYNYAYEEAGEEAVEMERVYAAALAGESDINHMTSVVMPQSQQQQHQNTAGLGHATMAAQSTYETEDPRVSHHHPHHGAHVANSQAFFQ